MAARGEIKVAIAHAVVRIQATVVPGPSVSAQTAPRAPEPGGRLGAARLVGRNNHDLCFHAASVINRRCTSSWCVPRLVTCSLRSRAA
jgi:hypothetical protein